MMLEKGYIIRSTSAQNFDTDLINIYELLTNVYSNFPLYKDISKEQFVSMFGYLKYVLDFDMVKVVYKDGKLAGFFVSVPNYGNLTSNINFGNLAKIKKIKKNGKDYILLYSGIGKEHPGLGSAMAEVIKEQLVRKKAYSIGALIHDGKVTNNYYKNLIINKWEYVLMEKVL